MRNKIAYVFLLLVAVLTILALFRLDTAVAPSDKVIVETPRLRTTVVLDGLSRVWDVAQANNGTILFTERSGEINRIQDGKKVSISQVADVFVKGEGGLLGMTLDPEFESNRYLYACYNTSVDVRVSRWKVAEDYSNLSGKVDVVTGMPVNTTTFPGRHSGCRPRFGADGNLWIGTGDVAVGTYPQAPDSLGGKILRVNRDGIPVPGNLTVPFDARIYSYGHRNVQGLAMFANVKNGNYGFSAEHGSDRDDELNQLIPGNFGWDPVPGYNEAVDMTDSKKFPEAIPAAWKSGRPTTAPSGATELRGANWKSWNGAIAVAMLKGQEVRIMTFDDNGKLENERVLFKNQFGRIRSIVAGNNGTVLITTDNGSDDKIVTISSE